MVQLLSDKSLLNHLRNINRFFLLLLTGILRTVIHLQPLEAPLSEHPLHRTLDFHFRFLLRTLRNVFLVTIPSLSHQLSVLVIFGSFQRVIVPGRTSGGHLVAGRFQQVYLLHRKTFLFQRQ
uniref:(northern house mosquito) hypothetical protein n=1 Tax=Culex pipiens TaxID=7175 RepID=A0A8D8PF26_CULPI